jgi:hypothetical protein
MIEDDQNISEEVEVQDEVVDEAIETELDVDSLARFLELAIPGCLAFILMIVLFTGIVWFFIKEVNQRLEHIEQRLEYFEVQKKMPGAGKIYGNR